MRGYARRNVGLWPVVLAACSGPATTPAIAEPAGPEPRPAVPGRDEPEVPALVGATAPTTASGGLTLLAEIAAWDVLPREGRLIVIDAGFLSATALDATTGTVAWTTKIEETANGRHSLHAVNDDVIEWAGDTLHLLDAKTGARIAAHKRSRNGVAWDRGGCGLDLDEGVCAMFCQCSFQVFDCVTNRDLGKRYESLYMSMSDPDGDGGSAGCWGGGGTLLGRVGGHAMISAEDHNAGSADDGPTVTAAIDLAKGIERWRVVLESPVAAALSGHTPDGKTCWFGGYGGALTGIDCASGRRLWTTPSVVGAARHRVDFMPAHGIFDAQAVEGGPVTAALLHPRSGKPKWSVRLPAATLAWVEGTQTPIGLPHLGVESVVILAASDGTPIATAVVPPKTAVMSDRAGGFVLIGAAEIVAHDARGRVTGRAPLASPRMTFGDTMLVAALQDEIVVLAQGDLRELGRLSGNYDVVHVEGSLGPATLAAFDYDGKSIGRLALARIDRR